MLQEENSIFEAKRYLANAKMILEKNKIEGKYYANRKYVREAGKLAWNGVLIALEAVFQVKNTKSASARPDFNDYLKIATKQDKKITKTLANGYEVLHKFMGYDGILSVNIVKEGLLEAKTIIEWCEQKYKA
jgi:hypothetical protein